MRWTIAGLVFVGLIAAVSAAVLAVTLRADFGVGPGNSESEEVEVIVAARALPAMTMIDSASIAREKVKRSGLLPKAVTNSSQIIGRVLMGPVLAGQQFTTTQFASSDSGLQLAATIPEGFRGVSITLADDSGIGHVLFPGSIVDVIASFKLPSSGTGGPGEVVSFTLLQNIQVLTVGERSIIAPERPESPETSKRGRMITLMVNTAQAEALQFAVTQGDVTVAIRNPLDTTLVNATGTKMSDISKGFTDEIRKLMEQVSSPTPVTLPEFTKPSGGAGNQGNGGAPSQANTAAIQSPVPETPVWTTTVYRGRLKEIQKFTLPPEPEAH